MYRAEAILKTKFQLSRRCLRQWKAIEEILSYCPELYSEELEEFATNLDINHLKAWRIVHEPIMLNRRIKNVRSE